MTWPQSSEPCVRLVGSGSISVHRRLAGATQNRHNGRVFVGDTAMLRKAIQAAAVLALLTGPAAAQSMNMTPDFSSHKTQGEQQRDREIELKYHETVDSLPDRK